MTQYDSGTSLAIKGFAVAIFGGLGNSMGAVAGGIIMDSWRPLVSVFFLQHTKML
jgi:branched-subunit amino acid ABC-type transport system permease component